MPAHCPSAAGAELSGRPCSGGWGSHRNGVLTRCLLQAPGEDVLFHFLDIGIGSGLRFELRFWATAGQVCGGFDGHITKRW